VEERRDARSRPRVLVWEEGYTYGRQTMVDDVVRRGGGIDVAAEAGLLGAVPLTEEAALAFAPDVILVPVTSAAVLRRAPELLGDAPVWQAVAAVQRGEVYGVPRRWIGSVSLPAVDALEAVADILGAREP
jgi:iron complex transport system substrate-binding protein